MAIDTAEQQRFASKYAAISEKRRQLISLKAFEKTREHLESDQCLDLPGYPSEDGALEIKLAELESQFQQFFTSDLVDHENENLKQQIDNLKHRLSSDDDEISECLKKIDEIKRAMQNLDEHPELVKADAELAPLVRQRDKLRAKLEAGKSKNPEAEFRRPFSASHFRFDS